MSHYEMSHYDTEANFSDLIGKTLVSVSGQVDGEEIEFVCADGSVFKLYHSQDCCESVTVESITGDLADLIGSPILRAEEATSDTDPEGYAPQDGDCYRESFTWTFYKLATVKGWVDIRWYGTSNGCYSESVSFVKAA